MWKYLIGLCGILALAPVARAENMPTIPPSVVAACASHASQATYRSCVADQMKALAQARRRAAAAPAPRPSAGASILAPGAGGQPVQIPSK